MVVKYSFWKNNVNINEYSLYLMRKATFKFTSKFLIYTNDHEKKYANLKQVI